MPCSQRHIAILVETDDSWGRSVVEAIALHARTAGWTLLIGPRDQQRRLRLPKGWRGDGVIVSLRDQATARHVKAVGVPAVDVSITMPGEDWLGRVATDDAARAQVALEHFRARGMKQFACYAPPIGRYPDARARCFAEAVHAGGFSCDVFSTSKSRQGSGWLADYTRASKWLQRLPRPVAVFASDAYPARQLAEICQRDGIRIPSEVAIIAGDNDELLCNVAWPRLTSVELASHRIGEVACRLLTEQMDGGAIDLEPTLVPPLRVLGRHSTDTLWVPDQEISDVLHVIRDEACDGIDVSDLLKRFSISRRGLELKFNELLGRTPAAEIRRVRLEQAQRLLLETELSIESIATRCGFASGPSLSHTFRKHFDVTPGGFRDSRR